MSWLVVRDLQTEVSGHYKGLLTNKTDEFGWGKLFKIPRVVIDVLMAE